MKHLPHNFAVSTACCMNQKVVDSYVQMMAKKMKLPKSEWMFVFDKILFYGFGLHAAGFFMPRGIKVFGGLFVAAATLFACLLPVLLDHFYVNTNILMAFFFGVLHLAYGGYLYVSEKRKQTA